MADSAADSVAKRRPFDSRRGIEPPRGSTFFAAARTVRHRGGTISFRPSRYDGGGMRYLRFRSWLEEAERFSEMGLDFRDGDG